MSSARTLGDLVRRGRHLGLEVHVLTQRVTDWLDSRIARTDKVSRRPRGSAPLVGAGVLIGHWSNGATNADHVVVVVRVIDAAPRGGSKVVSMQVVPLR